MSAPESVIGFRPGFDDVCLRQVSEHGWVTMTQLHYRAREQTFIVPAQQATDLASVPRPVAALVPSYGRYTDCAILHDHLWRVEIPKGQEPGATGTPLGYREADGILRQAMRTKDVPFITRWVMWAAVRWGSLLTRPNGHVDWLKDAPLVLLWSLIAILPVLVVAIPTTAVLGLVWFVEAIAYLVLRVVGNRKRVVPPSIGTHL